MTRPRWPDGAAAARAPRSVTVTTAQPAPAAATNSEVALPAILAAVLAVVATLFGGVASSPGGSSSDVIGFVGLILLARRTSAGRGT